MAGNEDDDPLTGGGSYSQLLFADDDDVSFNFCSSFLSDHTNSPKMLCFGDYAQDFGANNESIPDNNNKASPIKTVQNQKSGVTCSDSSSASSINNSKINTLPKSNKKRNGAGSESVENPAAVSQAPAGNQRNCKKNRAENSNLVSHAKVKKEKLGERITALQQLVSPFGKTDTASVLHEAMGYIRFLHDQVHVLSSPYLQRLPAPPPSSATETHVSEDGENSREMSNEVRKDLRSKGLCLVPLEFTLHVADCNGADLWSSAMSKNITRKNI